MTKRVQVQGLGEAPTVQPVDLPGFQYGITQKQAGTNNLLKLAGNLEQFGKITRGYASLVQQESARDQQLQQAQAIQQQEVQREQDKFDQVLLKQHLNTVTLPSLQQQAESLVDVQKYTKREQTSQAIDEVINKEWEALSEALGGGVADSLASKALWNSVIPQYKQKLLAQYEKNREDFITDAISDEIGTYLEPLLNRYDKVSEQYVIDELGIKNAVKIFDQRLAEQLPNLTKPQRSQFLVDKFSIKTDGLYAAHRYTDAARMLSVLKTVELNGAPIFETTTAESKLNQIEFKINRAVQIYSDKKDTKKKGVYTNIVTEATKGLLQVTTLDQLEQNPMLKAELMDSFSFNGLGNGAVLTEERKEQAIRDLFDKTKPGTPVEKFQVELKKLAREGGDESRDQLMEVKDDIDRNFIEAIKTPGAPVVLDSLTKKDIIENPQYGLRKQKELNPKLTLYEFIKNHPIKFTEFNELRKEFVDLDRGSYVYNLNVYKNARSILDNKLTQVDASIIESEGITDTNDKTMIKSMREAYVDSVISDLEDAIIEEAKLPEVLESTNQEKAIRSELDELIATNAERYKGQTETRLKKKNIFSDPMTDEEMGVELETEVKLRKTQRRKAAEIIEFKSLEKPKKVTKRVGRKTVVVPQQISFELIKQDRQKMLEGGFQTKKHLRLSLARYGFQSWNPTEAVTMLDSAGLSYKDVKLFGSYAELQKTMDRWTPVMYKDIGYIEDSEGNYVEGDPEPLTVEEEKIREEYQSFGLLPLDINYINENVFDGPNGFEESQLIKLR
jgi:hypothetical protein